MGGGESKENDSQISEMSLEILAQFKTDFLSWHRYHVEHHEKANTRMLAHKAESRALMIAHQDQTHLKESLRPIKAGYLTKMGLQVKNWKRRFVVLYNNTDNFTAHYFTDEQMRYEKGNISLYGYFVRPFHELEEKKFGSHGIVLQHRLEGRRRWMLRADTAREQHDWIQALTAACNLAIRDVKISPIIQDSFCDALKTTRSIYGYFGACVPRGRSEEELLLLLVTNVIHREVLENLNTTAGHSAATVLSAGTKSSRTNPAAVAAAKEAQRKSMERMVQTMVTSQWQECLKEAQITGPILAKKLQSSLQDISFFESKVIAHIDADLGELVQPVALEQYNRVLEPLVSRCVDPLLSAWEKGLVSLVRCVLDLLNGGSSANIRTVAGELHALLSGSQLIQGIGGEGPLAGAALALWRLETEDLGLGLAETFAPSDAVDLALIENDNTVRNNLMMNAANAGEELSPEMINGLAAASSVKQAKSGLNDRPICDGRLFTAMMLDVLQFSQDFLSTVERLLLRPEEADSLLRALHEDNMRNLYLMEQILQANSSVGSGYKDEVMSAVSRSFSLVNTAANGLSNLSIAKSKASVDHQMQFEEPVEESRGLGDGYWINDGFRTLRLTIPGREAEVLGILQEQPSSGTSASANSNGMNTGQSVLDDPYQSRDEESLHSSWLQDTVPVLFSQATRLQALQQEYVHTMNNGNFNPEINNSNNDANSYNGPSSLKDVGIQALRCALVLATRDITATIRRRLRETALSAMENTLQETLLGTAGDIALDLCAAAVDGYSIYNMTRPSVFRVSRFNTNQSRTNGHTPQPSPRGVRLSTRLQKGASDVYPEDDDDEDTQMQHTPRRLRTELTQSQVRLLAETRVRELMSRCVDRMLDKDMGEAGRRLRGRVSRLLQEEVSLPGEKKNLALAQSVSMATAIAATVGGSGIGSGVSGRQPPRRSSVSPSRAPKS